MTNYVCMYAFVLVQYFRGNLFAEARVCHSDTLTYPIILPQPGLEFNTILAALPVLFFLKNFLSLKNNFFFTYKTCFYKSTNIFKANILVRCHLLLFPCFSVASIFFLTFYFQKKKLCFYHTKLVFYKSTNIFKANALVRCFLASALPVIFFFV